MQKPTNEHRKTESHRVGDDVCVCVCVRTCSAVLGKRRLAQTGDVGGPTEIQRNNNNMI